MKQLKRQMTREPYPLPQLWLDPTIKSIDDFDFQHVKLVDYKSHPNDIKLPVAV
jgi:thymidylate synthase